MSAPSNTPWKRGSAPLSRAKTDLRVSDAERAEVSELLSKHYAAGRLDEVEFNERVDQAMSAKTQSDFSGLFADLPGIDVPAAPARRRHRYRHIVILVLVVLIGAFLVQELVRSAVPWLLLGLLAFVWLHHGSRHHQRP